MELKEQCFLIALTASWIEEKKEVEGGEREMKTEIKLLWYSCPKRLNGLKGIWARVFNMLSWAVSCYQFIRQCNLHSPQGILGMEQLKCHRSKIQLKCAALCGTRCLSVRAKSLSLSLSDMICYFRFLDQSLSELPALYNFSATLSVCLCHGHGHYNANWPDGNYTDLIFQRHLYICGKTF